MGEGEILRVEQSVLERETARQMNVLTWALSKACEDGWTDGPAAMRHYLMDAEAALSDEGGDDG